MTRTHTGARHGAGWSTPVGILVAVLVGALVGAPMAPAGARQETAPAVAAPATPITWRSQPPPAWPDPPSASARAYVLVDALTGQVLASRAADTPRIVASTVKLLTVLTALQSLRMEDEVVVGEAAAVGGAGTSVDPGETWQVADLVDAVMVRSGNDAALALASAAADGDLPAFVAAMQATADALGLQETTITEPTGLDDGNELSARDLATLARAAMADERIRAAAGQPSVDLPDVGVQENRNLLIGSYPGATGLKTGFTELAGYCLVATAERDGRELIAVVLGAREDPARFEEAAGLLDHAFEDLASTPYDAVRARHGGGWSELLPAGRVWAPQGQAVGSTLEGRADAFQLAFTADATLGTATVTVPDGTGDGVGAVLADALYTTMRQGHVVGVWPDRGATDTTAVGSG